MQSQRLSALICSADERSVGSEQGRNYDLLKKDGEEGVKEREDNRWTENVCMRE